PKTATKKDFAETAQNCIAPDPGDSINDMPASEVLKTVRDNMLKFKTQLEQLEEEMGARIDNGEKITKTELATAISRIKQRAYHESYGLLAFLNEYEMEIKAWVYHGEVNAMNISEETLYINPENITFGEYMRKLRELSRIDDEPYSQEEIDNS